MLGLFAVVVVVAQSVSEIEKTISQIHRYKCWTVDEHVLIFYKSFADLIFKANSARDRLGN